MIERIESRLKIWGGDITTLPVDAIVNAAAPELAGGRGVDGAIHRAAGPELLRACLALPEAFPGIRCPTGEARITPGFELPASYVIHTVGPVWRGGGEGEAGLLESCYRASLRLAVGVGVRTIAFPAISCGTFGYPVEPACRIAVETVAEALARDHALEAVFLTAWGGEVRTALEDALRRLLALDGSR